jgi:hypothetical protein
VKKEYTYYTDITKEILDNIKVGMFVKINDWKRPMKVVGVSENYFCMIQKVCGKICYSICEKKPWGGIRHNEMQGGMFHCGTDNMVFGAPGFDYEFNDENEIKRYLQMFEEDKIELSRRTSVPIYKISFK